MQLYNIESVRKGDEFGRGDEYVGRRNCGIFPGLAFAMECMTEPKTIRVSIRLVRTVAGPQGPTETCGQPLTFYRDTDGSWSAEW